MWCPMACSFPVTRKYPYLADKFTEHREQEAMEFAHRTAYLSCAYRLQDLGSHEQAEAMILLARKPLARKILAKIVKAKVDGNSD